MPPRVLPGRPWWVLVLVQDPLDVYCLMPRSLEDYCALEAPDGVAVLPRERSIRCAKPLGQHWMIAVQTAAPLGDAVVGELTDPSAGMRLSRLRNLYTALAILPAAERRLYRLPFVIEVE